MTEDEVLSEFRASQALLEGHFKLSSGRHSAYYLQCARVLMNAERAGALGVHQHARALQVIGAVAARRELEVTLEQGLARAELGEDLVFSHGFGRKSLGRGGLARRPAWRRRNLSKNLPRSA